MNRHTYLCLPCRAVTKRVPGYPTYRCHVCAAPLRHMGYRWRPPTKRNEAAWRRIASGDIFWEDDSHRNDDWRYRMRWRVRRSNPKHGVSLLRPDGAYSWERP